jgi:hypothetical protein
MSGQFLPPERRDPTPREQVFIDRERAERRERSDKLDQNFADFTEAVRKRAEKRPLVLREEIGIFGQAALGVAGGLVGFAIIGAIFVFVYDHQASFLKALLAVLGLGACVALRNHVGTIAGGLWDLGWAFLRALGGLVLGIAVLVGCFVCPLVVLGVLLVGMIFERKSFK